LSADAGATKLPPSLYRTRKIPRKSILLANSCSAALSGRMALLAP
jgi:hypothetical protein